MVKILIPILITLSSIGCTYTHCYQGLTSPTIALDDKDTTSQFYTREKVCDK
jgi:hypothetical protein